MGEEATPFQELGGEDALRLIIDDFINRVTSDLMIGFLFRKVDKERLKKLEWQFALGHLGGPKTYEGRDINQAHAAHRIMGGQFDRRLHILRQTLDDHKVAPRIRELWLAHNESLRAHITRDQKSECIGPETKV